MSLFSKLSKNTDKSLYPWSQKKLSGSNSVLPRAGHAAAAVSPDAVIIYGGIHKASTKKELFYIDTNTISANSIHVSGDIPSSRISPTMVAMNHYVLLYGGKPVVPNEKYDNGFYILNLNTRQWSRLKLDGSQPMERFGHTAVAQDGIMYIWGGQQEGHYFNDMFIFNTGTTNSSPKWEQIPYASTECPEARSGHISVIFENKLYMYSNITSHHITHAGNRSTFIQLWMRKLVADLFGGTNGRRLFNDIWSFDLQSRSWTKIEADGFIPTARESCAAAMSDDVIYIIGGKGENNMELNDLCAYKIRSRRWFKFQNMGPSPSPRFGLTMTAVNNRLFVVGGDNENAKMEDSSLIYVLDCLKIKYPADTPSPQTQQQPSTNPVTNNINNIQQQQQQQQTPYEGSPMDRMTRPLPQQQVEKVDQQQQTQWMNNQPPPSSPIQQQNQQCSPAATAVLNNMNSLQKDGDSSTYYSSSESQPSPLSNHSNSPSSASPRHRSFFPDPSSPSQQAPPVRPPRHISTIPEAALRRPRATSPLPPSTEIDITTDLRRQYQSPISSPTPMEKQNSNLSVPDMHHSDVQQPQKPQQQQQQRGLPSSSNNNLTPPPRPPRDGVGLGSIQRNTVMSPTDVFRRGGGGTADLHEHDEVLRPKSQIPTSDIQHQRLQLQLQQPSEPIPERSPSRQQQQHDVSTTLTNSTSASPRPSKSLLIQQPQAANSPTATAAAAATLAVAEERQTLLREIANRDTIISEMKKKENWWRMEVSLARKMRQSLNQQSSNKEENEEDDDHHHHTGQNADEANLMDMEHLSADKLKLFEQLVSVKTDLRRVRASLSKQAQPIAEKVSQADRMRTAALQEAAYFKSKYLALKASRRTSSTTPLQQQEDHLLTESRCDDLEKRLAAALIENEASMKLLQQLQKRSQHDQTARQATEERAREAHQRAEEAQQAHQRALEELQLVYSRATKAEMQMRDNASKIADLTQQLRDALLANAQPVSNSQELTEAQLRASQLEAANLKARNEAAMLKQKLAEQMDDIARLRTLVQEREDALAEAKLHTEDCEIQLKMMREAIQQQHQKLSGKTDTTPSTATNAVKNNTYSSTKAY